jgi:hypothetical protein
MAAGLQDAPGRIDVPVGGQQDMHGVELGRQHFIERRVGAGNAAPGGGAHGLAAVLIADARELDVGTRSQRFDVRIANEARAEQADLPAAAICIR